MSQPVAVSPNAFRLKCARHDHAPIPAITLRSPHRGSCAAFRSQIRSQHSTQNVPHLSASVDAILLASAVVALSRKSRDREADELIGHPRSGYRRRDPPSRGSESLPKVSARSPALFQQQRAIPFFRWKRLRNKPIRAGQTGHTGPISGRWASASETGGGQPADRSRC
jgi:hypothetical protein